VQGSLQLRRAAAARDVPHASLLSGSYLYVTDADGGAIVSHDADCEYYWVAIWKL
jgi:hypothetical protein